MIMEKLFFCNYIFIFIFFIVKYYFNYFIYEVFVFGIDKYVIIEFI